MEIQSQKIEIFADKFRSADPGERLRRLFRGYNHIIERIRCIGFVRKMDDYEKRKLGVFNLLNFFQLLSGFVVPILGMTHSDHLPKSAWLFACLPSATSIIVLAFNYFRRYDAALLSYFILYPFLTCIVYMHGMNSGIGLQFILYGILSVFFLQDIGYMLFTIALSMVSYFILSVVLKDFIYQVETENKFLYLFNQFLAIIFIFYGLFLIKKENTNYYLNILDKNRILNKNNTEINKQKEIIDHKANLMQRQAVQLAELNNLKNKLFSLISHDLKSPMYALRNLFRNVQQFDLPAEEVKQLMPDVVNDLNYTIGLMENLLQWAKSQMQADVVRAEQIEITQIIREVILLLRLQAENKCITIEAAETRLIYAFADKDMINLVIRNLISNAIKFTPMDGHIKIGINQLPNYTEVYIQDSGLGISKEAMEKINASNFYTTKGTSSESGTGLGLMLCKEFLSKNGGKLYIESEAGKGTTISFTLPLA